MDDCAAQIAHHSRRPKRPVRFLITAAVRREEGWCMECCSHDCAACSAVQLALRVVPLHAPLAAGCTRRQSLLARLDTWAPSRLLLVRLEPALLGSLHLRHCVTMWSREGAAHEVAPRCKHVSRRYHEWCGYRESCAAQWWGQVYLGCHAQLDSSKRGMM